MKENMTENNSDRIKIKTYLDAIQSLSESTDDYMLLWEIEADKIWFFGNIEEKYNLMSKERTYCTIEEWSKIVYPKDLPVLEENLNKILEGTVTKHDMEYRIIDREGKRIWISCRGMVKKDATGHAHVMIGRVSDTALRYKVDLLTGMFNMSKMNEDMERVLSAGQNGFLLVLGIDNLKNINIKHGWESGNQTLKFFARILEEAAGSLEIYRAERDCFAVCMPGAELEEVRAFFCTIQKMLSEHFTVSGGAVAFEWISGRETGKLYQYAEYALDRAKKAGKNEMEIFNEEDYQKEVSSIELLEELENSVKNGCLGFSLVYQPQIKTESYELFGAESLLRYDSPTQGRVMPNEFVPLLEQSGLICEVGYWILKTALEQCKEWRKWMPDFHISVNMSYVQLEQNDIGEKVMEILSESGLPGDALTIEVTESMQIQNFQYYNGLFSGWRNEGIEISVDDFGTGYSCLAYLKHLMIDEIKVDRCFVRGIQNSSYNYRLLFNLIELASSSQVRVCCEGVEEREELQVLEELKPDLLQGYFFSKPCEADLFEQMFFDRENPKYQEYRKRIGQAQNKRIGKLLNMRHRDILRATNLGLWIIRLNGKSGNNEMYADETMRHIMGADKGLSPEECYRYWDERIKDECRDYVNASEQKMILGKGAVELQYIWEHPKFGDVKVRCTGIRTEDVDGMICLEGYHRMVNDIEMTWLKQE